MHSINEFDAFIGREFVYQHNLISVISDGKHHLVHNHGDLVKRYNGCSIKLEGLERYSKELAIKCAGLKILYDHTGPITCHAYRSYPGSKSFGLHSDPIPVFLEVIEGTKNIIVNDDWHTLSTGDTLFIPANVPHEAINQDDSLMLSFGLEFYLIDQ